MVIFNIQQDVISRAKGHELWCFMTQPFAEDRIRWNLITDCDEYLPISTRGLSSDVSLDSIIPFLDLEGSLA